MSFFKSLANVALPGASLTSKLVTGKSLGSHAERLLGGGRAPAQYTPDTSIQMGDRQRILDYIENNRGKVSESGQARLDALNLAGQRDLDAVYGQTGGVFQKGKDQMAMYGGMDRGGVERLAKQQAKDTGLFAQKMRGRLGEQRADIVADDLGQSRAFEERAITSALPQIGGQIAGIQDAANRANMRASALADAQKAKRISGITSLVGMGAGFALGGPMGAAAGGSIGGGLGGLFANA